VTDDAVRPPQDLSAVPWPVRTERLVLRPAEPDDATRTWRFRSRPEVQLWITSATDDPADYAATFCDPHRLATTLVVERAADGGDEVVGDLMLRVQDAWGQAEVRDGVRGVEAEIGWVLHPDHGGQGLATEAVEALLRICFEHLGLRRVVAICFVGNEPSWRLMERVGMRREAHTVRDSLHRSGRWLDGYSYAMLADEWAARTSSSRGAP
jgi:RimJ/RimL family protein N-acetyltransferase